MARNSYRIKRWVRTAKDWRDYIIYLGQVKKRGGGEPPVPPISLRLSAGNVLFPGFVTDRPVWFQGGVDFTLAISGGGTVTFTWATDRWTTTGDFPTASGSGTLTQGTDTSPAIYSNAEYPANFITAALGVRITGASGIYITWS